MALALRWVVGATLIMACAMGIGRFAYTPLLPQMVAEFGWSFAAAGDVASANFLGYMVGAMLAPKLAGSPAARNWLAVSLMASVLTTYLGAEVIGLWQWVAVRFASGVASALCLVVMTTHLIYQLQSGAQERLGNVHFAGVGVGILLCMASVYGGGSSTEQWARLGAVSAVAMAIAWMLVARGRWRAPDAVGGAVGTGAAGSELPRLILGYGFFGFGYVVAATFVVAMAARIDMGAFQASDVWVVVGLSLVPSVYLWQALANRIGLNAALRSAYLVESIGLILAGASSTVQMLMLSCVLLGGTFAAITALGISAARMAAPHRIAFAVSAMTVSFALGQFLGPALAGRAADYFGGFFWPSVIAGLLLMAAAILVPRPAPQVR